MRAVRVAAGLGTGGYGVSYLWLAPAAVRGATGPVWTVVEVLVVATAAGFIAAAWGLAKAAPWGERLTAGAAVAGLLTLIPYLVASAGVRDSGTIANAALHALGCAAILLALSIPPAERTLSRRARHGLAVMGRAGHG